MSYVQSLATSPSAHVGISGDFEIHLINAKTGEIKQHIPRFHNLITNGGMDIIGSSDSELTVHFNALEVGTGTTTPAFTDTALATPLTPRTTANGGFAYSQSFFFVSGSYALWEGRITRLFTETEANGNISELGFWTLTTGGTLMNRSLIKDGSGTPTSITKTSNDQLRVTFFLRTYVPMFTVSSSIQIGPTTHAFELIPIGANPGGGSGWEPNAFGDWTSGVSPLRCRLYSGSSFTSPITGTIAPLGTQVASDDATAIPYTSSNYYRDFDFVYEPSSFDGTVTSAAFDIAGLRIGYAIKFTPAIIKNSLQRLRFIWRVNWNRAVKISGSIAP